MPVTEAASSPLLPRQALLRRLLFPVRADINALAAALAALGSLHESRNFGIAGIARHVDQRRVPARIIEAGRKQPAHAERAHHSPSSLLALERGQ